MFFRFSRKVSIERAVEDCGDIVIDSETIQSLGRQGVKTIEHLMDLTPKQLMEVHGIGYYDALSLGHLILKQRRAKGGVHRAEHELV